MRIAWTGETGARGAAGVAGVAFTFLEGLAARGHEIDAFVQSYEGAIDPSVSELPGVATVARESWWRWDRWYSRGNLLAFLSSSVARIQVQRWLGRAVLDRHAERPYDVIFQMSQFESFFAGRRAGDPPLVVHPCTIAASEAHWHHRERALARTTESAARFALVDALLFARGRLQRRHARAPDVVVGPSQTFVDEISRCYDIPIERCRVLRHPARAEDPARGPSPDHPARLLFVSRISSRKGVELVVDVSHRLDDLASSVSLDVIGGHTLWSDYSGLLAGLNPRVAAYAGEVSGDVVLERMRSATALLVPSRFEPGSIATGEALSLGLPVIASSAVGPSEILTERSGRVFPDGDAAAFEQAIRGLLTDYASDGTDMQSAAREVAEQHLDRKRLVARLEEILETAAKVPR